MIDLTHVSFHGVQPKARSTRATSGIVSGRRPAAKQERDHSIERHPELAAWILARAGIDPAAYRSEFAARRAAACLRHMRAPSADAVQNLIVARPSLLPQALDSILIGVTDFFRDSGVFDRLQHDLLPRLLKGRDGLRVLAAGVSSGQELYSIAMLLDQLNALRRSQLLGIDCRPRAIEQAAGGAYEDKEVAMINPRLLRRCFTSIGNVHLASSRIRQRIEWRCEDLLSFKDSTPRQLILFRNVAIYLRAEAAAPLWERLCSQLDAGGVLVAGRGEHPPRALPLTRVAPSIFRRN